MHRKMRIAFGLEEIILFRAGYSDAGVNIKVYPISVQSREFWKRKKG